VLRKVDVMLAKIFDLTGKRIYVTGHRGMVGSAIVRRLATCGCDVITANRDRVDLERQEQAEGFLAHANNVENGPITQISHRRRRKVPAFSLHLRPTLFLYTSDRMW